MEKRAHTIGNIMWEGVIDLATMMFYELYYLYHLTT